MTAAPARGAGPRGLGGVWLGDDPAATTDEQILERVLAVNQQRAASR